MCSKVFTFIRRSLTPLRIKRDTPNVTLKRTFDSNPHPEEHVTDWGDIFFFNSKNHRTLAIKFALFFGVPYWTPFILVQYQITKGKEKGDGGSVESVEDATKAVEANVGDVKAEKAAEANVSDGKVENAAKETKEGAAESVEAVGKAPKGKKAKAAA